MLTQSGRGVPVLVQKQSGSMQTLSAAPPSLKNHHGDLNLNVRWPECKYKYCIQIHNTNTFYLNELCPNRREDRQSKWRCQAASRSPWKIVNHEKIFPKIGWYFFGIIGPWPHPSASRAFFKCLRNKSLCCLTSQRWRCGRTCPSWPSRLPGVDGLKHIILIYLESVDS